MDPKIRRARFIFCGICSGATRPACKKLHEAVLTSPAPYCIFQTSPEILSPKADPTVSIS
jgi:hypothetical protein